MRKGSVHVGAGIRGGEADNVRCKDVQAKFMPFIDGKLDAKELEKFTRHVRGCRECREEYDIYYSMIMGMRYLESDGLGEFKIDAEQQLKEAEDYLLKYKILQAEKMVLLVIFLAGVIIFMS